MADAEEMFREVAERALGLAVSVFTLSYESGHKDSRLIAKQIMVEEDDERCLRQALAFVCKLLSDHMTPEQVLAAKKRVIAHAIEKMKHDERP